MSDNTAARVAWEFAHRVLQGEGDGSYDEAISAIRQLLAFLPEPIDPDLLEAREGVAGVYRLNNMPGLADRALAGEMDNRLRVQSALAAFKRGSGKLG